MHWRFLYQFGVAIGRAWSAKSAGRIDLHACGCVSNFAKPVGLRAGSPSATLTLYAIACPKELTSCWDIFSIISGSRKMLTLKGSSSLVLVKMMAESMPSGSLTYRSISQRNHPSPSFVLVGLAGYDSLDFPCSLPSFSAHSPYLDHSRTHRRCHLAHVHDRLFRAHLYP